MRFQTVIFAARAAALAAAFSCLSAASSVAAPPAQPAPHPAMLPLPPPIHDDPVKVALARQFIIAYHPRTDPKLLAAMLDKMLPGMMAQMKQENPKADVKKVAADRRAAVLKNAETALDRQAHVVSRHFSVQELKGLVAFYNGPLGKRLSDETPKIQMDLMRQRQMDRPPLPPGVKAMDVSKLPDQPEPKAPPPKKK